MNLVNNAHYSGWAHSSETKPDAFIFKGQILRDRARFSPGEIDGRLRENTRKALRAFTETKRLTAGQPLTPEVWSALASTSSNAVVTTYVISEHASSSERSGAVRFRQL